MGGKEGNIGVAVKKGRTDDGADLDLEYFHLASLSAENKSRNIRKCCR